MSPQYQLSHFHSFHIFTSTANEVVVMPQCTKKVYAYSSCAHITPYLPLIQDHVDMCVHKMDKLLGKIGSNITRLCQGICSCILLYLTSAGDRSCSSHQSCTSPQAMLQALCHKTHNTLCCTAGACSRAPRVEAVTVLQLSGCACISTHQLLLHDRPRLPLGTEAPVRTPSRLHFSSAFY